MSATKFNQKDANDWHQSQDSPIFLADVVDASNSNAMTAGFARYRKGASNDWIVMYDEVLIVTKGRYGVITEDGPVIAGPGEIIFLTKGTKLTYTAEEDSEVVYVSYPHWTEAQSNSENAHFMDTFHPVDAAKALQ